MPPDTPTFLLGILLGTGLLLVGVLLGYWMGRRPVQGIERQQMLGVLWNLSNWTNEFSGDVHRYQSQLNAIESRVRGSTISREELQELLSEIMNANAQLQTRLANTEQKLSAQTDQISHFVSEARTDGLTGLVNRRGFDQTLDELYMAWSRQETPFALGMIDIDHFKRINDTFGHQAGDAVLKQAAAQLRQELSDAVCVARFGGEEFSVVARCSVDQMAAALDSVRQLVASTPMEYEGQAIPVTLSAGASVINAGDTIGTLVRRADEALYASKLGGRNRVHLHDGNLCRLASDVASPPDAATPHVQPHGSTLETPEDAIAVRNAASRVQERLHRLVLDESQRLKG